MEPIVHYVHVQSATKTARRIRITDAGAFGSFVPATDTMSTAVASGGKQGAIIKMLKDAGAKEEEKGRMFVKFSWSFLDGC